MTCRTLIVDEIRQHCTHYRTHDTIPGNFDDFLAALSRQGTYIESQIEVSAAVNALNVNIEMRNTSAAPSRLGLQPLHLTKVPPILAARDGQSSQPQILLPPHLRQHTAHQLPDPEDTPGNNILTDPFQHPNFRRHHPPADPPALTHRRARQAHDSIPLPLTYRNCETDLISSFSDTRTSANEILS